MCMCVYSVSTPHTCIVFSVLVHSALVQIHFSWSVFSHPGQSLCVSHLVLLGQKMRCHGFILGVMPFRAQGLTHSFIDMQDFFLAFSAAAICTPLAPCIGSLGYYYFY